MIRHGAVESSEVADRAGNQGTHRSPEWGDYLVYRCTPDTDEKVSRPLTSGIMVCSE